MCANTRLAPMRSPGMTTETQSRSMSKSPDAREHTAPAIDCGAATIQPDFERKMRGSMNFKLKNTVAAILAVSLVALSANASDPAQSTQPAPP